MKLDQLLNRPSAWIHSDEKSGVVISSRIRLARNLRGMTFPGWAEEEENTATWERLQPILMDLEALHDCLSICMNDLTKLLRSVLFERHLISREHAEKGAGSGLVISSDESVSVMVNEEDHLRIQVISAGLDLVNIWKSIDALDTDLEAQVQYAFSPRLGYLTSCPSNVGTGMRASAMLHIPGLALLDEVGPVIKGCTKMGLTVRGLDGEGSDALGNIFQISNQVTLGRSEEELVYELMEVLLEVVRHEENARIRLVQKREAVLHNHVGRAFGLLSHAHLLSSKESIDLLSAVRLGVVMGFIEGLSRSEIDECMLLTRPAHLQRHQARRLKAEDRDILRANFVRSKLAQATLQL